MAHGHLDPASREPIDPDVDLRHPAPPEVRASELPVVAAIAVGGAVGASARYLIGVAWPTASGSLPWATLMINVVGCALIGVLMVLVSEIWTRHRLLRPLLGTGILGGFTTFSTYAVDIQGLINDGHPVTALLYLAITVVGALAVVWVTTTTTRALVHRRLR